MQFYTHQRRSRVKQPLRQLRGFVKVRLAPGESRTVSVDVPVGDLAFWDVTRGRFVVEEAAHTVQVGASSGDIRLCAPFRVRGERIPPRDLTSGPLDAADHDEYDGVVLCDAALDSGDAVRSTGPGAWIVFKDCDFGGDFGGGFGDQGPSACLLAVSSDEGGVVTLRLDDPLIGEVMRRGQRSAHGDQA